MFFNVKKRTEQQDVNLVENKNYLYQVYDKVAKQVCYVLSGVNSEQVIRANLKILLATFPLKDLELWKVGFYYDSDFTTIVPIKPEKISWNLYEFPVDKAENFRPLGDEFVQQYKQSTDTLLEQEKEKTQYLKQKLENLEKQLDNYIKQNSEVQNG